MALKNKFGELMSVEVKNVKDKLKEMLNEIDYDSLEGRGGAFLVTPVNSFKIFTREMFSDDQKMFADAAYDFATKRIKPEKDNLKELNKELTLEIFKELGELGFLGVDIPEEYGGSNLDKTTAAIVVDYLAYSECASILVSLGAHSGIGTLPIVWYGNEDQKKKYLPKIASGEWVAAYALTEPNAGSDALNGEAIAVLSDDKSYYILNGQKIYITNGAWASVCVTFAKVEGKMTGFILDKNCDGWVIGAEEKKMGIKGSSTTTIFFENCKVPVENVLGKVGQGAAIAFNSLYAGRWKLGFSSAAGCKTGIKIAYDFSKERKQFSRNISSFPMIQNKFSKMVVRTWESDTLNYFTTGSVDFSISKLDNEDSNYYLNVQKIIEDHAIEASICKVLGSEALAYCADEGVQIFGGAGFIEEYPAAAMYRDERINRIFEGTNEINRLIVGGILLKKAILEEMPIRDTILKLNDNHNFNQTVDNHILEKEIDLVEKCRKIVLNTLNELIIKYGQDLKNEQWVLEPYADMVISFSVMNLGIVRYNQMKESNRKNYTLSILRCSLSRHLDIIMSKSKYINNYIFDEITSNETNHRLESDIKSLNWYVDTISLEKSIYKTLNKYNGKYYLD